MNPFCLITFPGGSGDPKGGAWGGEVLTTLAAAGRLFEAMGNRLQRIHDGMEDELQLEPGPGMQIELPDDNVAVIEPSDVGLLVVIDGAGYPKLNIALGQIPSSPQLWSAADLCDAMAKFFMNRELTGNSATGGQPPDRRREIALPRTPMPGMPRLRG